ncbi:cell division protein PerM [Nesterenkonia marinintestina]|uniref:cell division protein PerM n=1 Tax=Nesterenkonia marinintestina TaxID=2979865 RepID=UPI0021BECF7F|nr:DUF6350 family protein [Nesterenkonia sp. GX14115]
MTTTDDDGTAARTDTRGGSSSRMARVRRLTRLPAPPLWLLGIVEAVQIALVTALAVLLPIIAMALADGFVAVDAGFVATLSAQLWSVMHGAPVILNVTVDAGALGEGVELPEGGWFQMLPMGLALIPLLLARRSGARLARGAYSGQLWQGLVTLVLTYAGLSAAIGALARTSAFDVQWPLTLLCGLLLVTVGGLAGAYSEARSWERLIGVDVEGRVERWSQSMRWAGSYAWAVCRAGAVAAVAAVVLASGLLAVQIGLRWMDIANMFQQLDPGVWGVVGLTLLHLALLPNLILWTLAYSTGAGFSMGTGTVVAPHAVEVGPMPAAPILGALPAGAGPWSLLVVLLPVLAGAVAGWWLVREGENHLDDWFSLRIPLRPVSLALSTLLLGLFTGLAAAVVIAAPLALSHISLGMGRMTDLGPHALIAAGMLGVWVAVGTMVGYLVTPAAHQVRRTRRSRPADEPSGPESPSADGGSEEIAETEVSAAHDGESLTASAGPPQSEPSPDVETGASASSAVTPEEPTETSTEEPRDEPPEDSTGGAAAAAPAGPAPRPRSSAGPRSAPASAAEVIPVGPVRPRSVPRPRRR